MENLGAIREQFIALNKKRTNADRLRAMSDEELAEFLTLIMMGEERSVPFIYSTVDRWLDWLKQEADK